MTCLTPFAGIVLALSIISSATVADNVNSQWDDAFKHAVSADFIIYPAQQESRVALDVASLLGWGSHHTIRLGETRWLSMARLLDTLPDRPSPRKYFEVRFGIVLLSKTGPVGSLFCRNPYAVAPSEVAVDCLVGDKVKVMPIETVRALVAVAFTPAER